MMDWQPIETAPKDGTSVLIGRIGAEAVFDGWWDAHEKAWVDGETDRYEDLIHYEPTHWMPLPAPPAEDK